MEAAEWEHRVEMNNSIHENSVMREKLHEKLQRSSEEMIKQVRLQSPDFLERQLYLHSRKKKNSRRPNTVKDCEIHWKMLPLNRRFSWIGF